MAKLAKHIGAVIGWSALQHHSIMICWKSYLKAFPPFIYIYLHYRDIWAPQRLKSSIIEFFFQQRIRANIK